MITKAKAYQVIQAGYELSQAGQPISVHALAARISEATGVSPDSQHPLLNNLGVFVGIPFLQLAHLCIFSQRDQRNDKWSLERKVSQVDHVLTAVHAVNRRYRGNWTLSDVARELSKALGIAEVSARKRLQRLGIKAGATVDDVVRAIEDWRARLAAAKDA